MFFIDINKTSKIPLIKQIYEQIKLKILSGILKEKEQLPSTRELASNLGISRNVVLEAYEQLFVEGYIESKKGAGTFVAKGSYLENFKFKETNCNEKNIIKENNKNNIINFRSGIPDLSLFPKKKWGDIYKQICSDALPSTFGYHSSKGCFELKDILSQYLFRARGVRCNANQIIITTGAAQAITLITRLLLKPNDYAVTEDPFNKDIIQNILNTGANIFPVPVDEYGLITEKLPNKINQEINPKFVFITASHQFPLGGILPINRRIDIINFAREKNCYIIEDDYDSEFRYEGAPIASFQSLEPDKVIYIGTFSKILSPALRMGYIILPNDLIENFSRLKFLEDLHSPILEQLALSKFIKDNCLEKHIRKSKKIYKTKQNLLIKCLKEEFKDDIKIFGISTGIHITVEFKNILFNDSLLKKIEKNGIKVYSVEEHSIKKGNHLNKIILGYGNLSQEQIIEGIKKLGHILKH